MPSRARRARPPGAEPLAERLILHALELLAEEGVEQLTLRRLARRADVSHGAPLRHFAGLADLRSEVAARGFALLSETVAKAGAQLRPGAGPLARLRAAGRAYVELAVANPALFALMFRPGDLEPANERFAREAPAAFEQLVRHVRAAQDAGWQVARETRVLAGSVWASVHGLAMLYSQGALAGPMPKASLEDLLTTTLALAVGDDGEDGGSR